MSDIKRKWCAMLAKLTSPMNPEDAAKGFVNMLPMLPQDDAAYNRDTLDRAARREPGDPAIPNFDVLSRIFGKWHRENRPIGQRLGANPSVPGITFALPSLPGPTPEQCQHIDDIVAAYKAEIARRPVTIKRAIGKASHLSTLQQALSQPRDAALLRPDWAEALRQHEALS